MVNYGNFFELLIVKTVDYDGNRMPDWNYFSAKIPSELTFYKRPFLLDYRKWSNNWFAQGGDLIFKKHLIAPFMLDERLHWNEMEDVQFSYSAALSGLFCYLDINNYLLTESSRIRPARAKNKTIQYFIILWKIAFQMYNFLCNKYGCRFRINKKNSR